MKNDKEKINIPFTKPKSLHELLQQGSGHNLTIDFSLLSKKGGLMDKVRKFQNINSPKKSEVNTDKTKISKNFEILSKLGKKKKNNEKTNLNNIQNKEININQNFYNNNIEKELIRDFNNKINIPKLETDKIKDINNINNDNISNECLELEYDKGPLTEYREIKEKNGKNNSNTKINTIKYNQNSEERNKLTNQNNQDYLYEEVEEEENPIVPQILNYTTYTNSEPPKKFTPKKININNNINRPFVITKSPNVDKAYNDNTKKYNSKKNYLSNQIIEYETIKESYTIKHCNCVLEYSFREDQNIDSEILMEDKSKSIENFNNDKNQMVFEIFDGHGGDEMSSYLQSNLSKIYKQNLLLNKGNIILSLKNAFHDADDEMRSQLNIEGLGSTGSLVHLVKEIKYNENPELVVYTANVGDSRVSLISPEHIIRLSYDHRTTDEKEKKRILESGMDIIDDRICGTLMLTRIFGNYEYKEYKEDNDNEEKSNNKGLICEPFISKMEIDLSIENQFLIIASDGIWDIITEEDIQNIIQKYKDTQKICSIIIKKCLENEAWDNMSVFAVKLT